MQRTTVMLPAELKLKAQKMAQARGISLGVLIRESLTRMLDQDQNDDWASDPLFDAAVFKGEDVLTDLAARHDDYLYAEPTL